MSDRLSEIIDQVRDSNLLDLNSIEGKLLSTNNNDRLFGLIQIRKNIEFNDPIVREMLNIQHENIESKTKDKLFDLALNHIEDTDNDCRWQSLIIISKYMNERPDEVWELILKYGSSQDDDMRMAIATILLEDFFYANPTLFNEKMKIIKTELKGGNKNLKETLSNCWFHFQTPSSQNLAKVRDLLAEC